MKRVKWLVMLMLFFFLTTSAFANPYLEETNLQNLLDQADKLFQVRDYENSQQCLTAALTLNISNKDRAEIYYSKGLIYFYSQKDWRKAAENFSNAYHFFDKTKHNRNKMIASLLFVSKSFYEMVYAPHNAYYDYDPRLFYTQVGMNCRKVLAIEPNNKEAYSLLEKAKAEIKPYLY